MNSPKMGHDVPKFCSDPDIVTGFQEELATIESANPWGFWEFITLKTNKYDIKNSISRNGIKYDIFYFPLFLKNIHNACKMTENSKIYSL